MNNQSQQTSSRFPAASSSLNIPATAMLVQSAHATPRGQQPQLVPHSPNHSIWPSPIPAMGMHSGVNPIFHGQNIMQPWLQPQNLLPLPAQPAQASLQPQGLGTPANLNIRPVVHENAGYSPVEIPPWAMPTPFTPFQRPDVPQAVLNPGWVPTGNGSTFPMAAVTNMMFPQASSSRSNQPVFLEPNPAQPEESEEQKAHRLRREAYRKYNVSERGRERMKKHRAKKKQQLQDAFQARELEKVDGKVGKRNETKKQGMKQLNFQAHAHASELREQHNKQDHNIDRSTTRLQGAQCSASSPDLLAAENAAQSETGGSPSNDVPSKANK